MARFDPKAQAMVLIFGDFELDLQQRELRKSGTVVAIAPKVFDLLCFIVQNSNRMVTKTEILERFWSTSTSEAALQKTISQLRKALSCQGSDVIKTHHGRGFRFLPHVEIKGDDATTDHAEGATLELSERHLTAVLSIHFEDSGSDAVPVFMVRAKDCVDRHEGTLLHMMADGFTAVFGINPFREDSARRAAHCGVALCALASDGDAPGIRCGIDMGRFDTTEFEQGDAWTVPGQTEQNAIAIARNAAAGHVLISPDSWKFLKNEAELEAQDGAYRVRRIAPLQAGVPDRPRKKLVRFIGREAELNFLTTKALMLKDGHGQVATVCGPAGIGKSRLTSEFLQSAAAIDFRRIVLKCLPALRNSPEGPIMQLCHELTDVISDMPVLDDIDTALLADLTGGHPDHVVLSNLSDHQRRKRGCVLVDKLLSHAGAERPVLLLVEDVHWLDQSSRTYVETFARDVDQKPVMIVMTTRPTEGTTLADPVLNLPPLSQTQGLALFNENVKGGETEIAEASVIVERAEGNPFYIEELALMAQVGGDAVVDLPPTVQSVMETRIGALKPSLRQIAYVISVIGPAAQTDLITHLTRRSASYVETDLQELVRTGFLVRDDDSHSFRHMLLQDAAYAMIADTDRASLHLQIAEHMAESHRAHPPELLAWHYQEAGERDAAIRQWIAASRKALARSARQEAIDFAENGLALLNAQVHLRDKSELDLLMCLAPAVTALRGFGAPDVGRAFRRAEELNKKIGNPKSEIRVSVGLWIHTWVRGDLTASLGHADTLMRLAKAFPDPALVLQANASRGQVLMHLGQFEAAMQHLEQGLAAIENVRPETAPAQNAATSCAAYASWVAALQGRNADCERYLAQSKAISELEKNPYAAAIHYALCSEVFFVRDEIPECLDYADAAIAISSEHDFVFWLGTGLVMRGWALGQQGDFAAAFDVLDEGITLFEGAGAGVQLANWYGLKAETLLTADDPEAAVASAQQALDCAARAEDNWFAPYIHQTLELALTRLGNSEAAEAHLTASRDLVKRFSIPPRLLRRSA